MRIAASEWQGLNFQDCSGLENILVSMNIWAARSEWYEKTNSIDLEMDFRLALSKRTDGPDLNHAVNLKAIAAMSENRVIGQGNSIPWHLPEDFKWFKKMTTGHIVVMGRKTFESIGKPLPNRTTIILSRAGFEHPGVKTISDLSELTDVERGLQAASAPAGEEALKRPEGLAPVDMETSVEANRQIFICGGAQVYEQALPFCSDLYLTLVKRTVEGDTFFPKFEDRFKFKEEILDCPDFKIVHYKNSGSAEL